MPNITAVLTSMYSFASLARMKSWGEKEVKNEPMFFNSSVAYAIQTGGPITRDFFRVFFAGKDFNQVSNYQMVFDSRVHMLMKGWWPCIPGWHHDDVPRLRSDGQPYYPEFEGDAIKPYRSQHAMAYVGSDVSATEFAYGSETFQRPMMGHVAYSDWDSVVNEYLRKRTLLLGTAPNGLVIHFDDRTWHRGQQATGSGWRWFGRVSWNTDRTKNMTNEIRKQVQVYMENPMAGW